MAGPSNSRPGEPRIRICVYCGAAAGVRPEYRLAAEELGRLLARARIEIIYGGRSSGLMGALAEAALSSGTGVHGVRLRIPENVQTAHTGLITLMYTDDLGARKRLMWGGADAIVVLPGGSGTADEVFEAITQKRLGAHRLPIFIVNVGGYYDGLLGFLEHAAREGFMSREQFLLWQTVSNVSEVVPLILAGISQAPCSAPSNNALERTVIDKAPNVKRRQPPTRRER